MEVQPADLERRLAAAAQCAPLLARAARERRRAAQRRRLLLHRPAVEQQLAAAERRLRPLRLVALGRALGLLGLPAVLIVASLKVAPPADGTLVGVDLPYTLLTIAVVTVALWPRALRPYMLLTQAFLIRALLIYGLLEDASEAGSLLIGSILIALDTRCAGSGPSAMCRPLHRRSHLLAISDEAWTSGPRTPSEPAPRASSHPRWCALPPR